MYLSKSNRHMAENETICESLTSLPSKPRQAVCIRNKQDVTT